MKVTEILETAFLHSRDIVLGGGKYVELWNCPWSSGALERVPPPRQWENATFLDDEPDCGTLCIMRAVLPGWPKGRYLWCCVQFAGFMHPNAMLWEEQGLLVVTTNWACWGLSRESGEVVFRFQCLYPKVPTPLPDRDRLLVPAEISLECLTPDGEVEWWCHADPPYDLEFLPDGNIRMQGCGDPAIGACEIVDARTGEVTRQVPARARARGLVLGRLDRLLRIARSVVTRRRD